VLTDPGRNVPAARRALLTLVMVAVTAPVPAALAAPPGRSHPGASDRAVGPEAERLLAVVAATQADVRQAAAELHAAIAVAAAARDDVEAAAVVRRRWEILQDQLGAARSALDEAAVLRPDPALEAADRLLDRIHPSFESAVTTLAEGASGLSAADLRENILASARMTRLASYGPERNRRFADRADADLIGGAAVLAARVAADPALDDASRSWGAARGRRLWWVLAEADAEADPAERARRRAAARDLAGAVMTEAARLLDRGRPPAAPPVEPAPVTQAPEADRRRPPAATDAELARRLRSTRRAADAWRQRIFWGRIGGRLLKALMITPEDPGWGEQGERRAAEFDTWAASTAAELRARVHAIMVALDQDDQARRLAYEAARADPALLGQAEAADADLATGIEATGEARELFRALGDDDEAVVALDRQLGRLDAMRAAEAVVGAPYASTPAGIGAATARLRAGLGPDAGLDRDEAFLVAGAAELARQVAHTTSDETTRAWAGGRAARLSWVLAEADAITVERERRIARAKAADLAVRVIEEALPHLGGTPPPDGRPPVVPPGDDDEPGPPAVPGEGAPASAATVRPMEQQEARAATPAAGTRVAPAATAEDAVAEVVALVPQAAAPATAQAAVVAAPVVVPSPARVPAPETVLALAAAPASAAPASLAAPVAAPARAPGAEPVIGARLRELFGVRAQVGGELAVEAAPSAPPLWSAGGPAVQVPGR
jgi:hypothetical protein